MALLMVYTLSRIRHSNHKDILTGSTNPYLAGSQHFRTIARRPTILPLHSRRLLYRPRILCSGDSVKSRPFSPFGHDILVRLDLLQDPMSDNVHGWSEIISFPEGSYPTLPRAVSLDGYYSVGLECRQFWQSLPHKSIGYYQNG